MPQTNDDEKRIGLAFPLRIEAAGENDSRLAPCTYEEHIKQSLRALLLTARGERVMRPEFGSALGAYLFEGIDVTTASLIKREVKSTVERFETRVDLLDVEVHYSAQDPAVLQVAVNYRIKSTGGADQLTVSVSGTKG